MIALVTVRSDQDWVGGAIIMACGIVILGVGLYWDRRAEHAHWSKPLLVPEDLPVPDHARCVYVDADGVRCPTVLCFDVGLDDHGLPIVCTNAEAPACSHSLVSRATTGGHCYRHVSVCPDCRVEDASLWGHVR